MKNWFKKLVIPSGEKTEVVAYNSWVVKWQSRNGPYMNDYELQAEIFPSEIDAIKFAEQLTQAFALLRYKGVIVKVTLEANQSKLATLTS